MRRRPDSKGSTRTEGLSDPAFALRLLFLSNLKILHFFTQKEQKPGQNLEVHSQKTENRAEYADFDFLLGNPPTCSEY